MTNCKFWLYFIVDDGHKQPCAKFQTNLSRNEEDSDLSQNLKKNLKKSKIANLQMLAHLMMKDHHKYLSTKTQKNPLSNDGAVAFESRTDGRTDGWTYVQTDRGQSYIPRTLRVGE